MTLLSRVLHHHTDKSLRRAPRPARALGTAGDAGAAAGRGPAIALHIHLESPPVVLYGHAHESTGSLLSGVLTLDVQPLSPPPPPPPHASPLLPALSPHASAPPFHGLSPHASAPDLHPLSSALFPAEPPTASAPAPAWLTPVASGERRVEVDAVVLLLVQTMHYTKPFVVPSGLVGACKSCGTRTTTLAQWDVLLEQAAFPAGAHAYPFSHLLPGLLAASAKLGGAHSCTYIKYDLVAVACAGATEARATLPVNVLRSVLRGPDRNSLRVFPPTDVTASAVLPGVMYPKSTFPIELKMSRVVNARQGRRWRLRKLLWKLEEHTQVAAYACPEHAAKIDALEHAQRKLQAAKALRAGACPNGAASPGAGGPSKSNGMHHLTVQTLMFVGMPPAASQGAARAAVEAANLNDGPTGNHDVVEPEEEAPTNRVADEVVHFDEDFGLARENGTTDGDGASPGARTSTQVDASGRTPSGTPNETPRDTPAGSPASLQAEEGEALFLDELRVVAHGDIKSGWKSDFLGDGTIELVADILALECSSGIKRHSMKALSEDTPPDDMREGLRNDANISCDIDDPVLGVYVSHVLVLEVIIAEEIVLQSRTSVMAKDGLTPVTSASSVASASNTMGVPTGAARVLRMQFKVVMTERSGLGIAWDDEVPPMYEDVRALSPPTYETLAAGTPNSLRGMLSPVIAQRPAVIYGLGDTPLVGSFVPSRTVHSIDAVTDLDDGVQEFRL